MHWVGHSNTKITKLLAHQKKITKLLQSYKMNHVWTAKLVWFIVLFALCSIKICTVIWKSGIRQMSLKKKKNDKTSEAALSISYVNLGKFYSYWIEDL